MGWIRDSILEYREFYSPVRRNFSGWGRGALTSLVAILCLLALLSLLFLSGWFLAGANRDLAEFLRKLGEMLRVTILPAALTGWVVLALANLRTADSLLDEALLGRRGSAAAFRFMLAVHSGLWPLISAFLLNAMVMLAQYFHSVNSTTPAWLGQHESWDSMMDHLQRMLLMQLGNLPAEFLHYAAFTCIALAMACMSRKAQTVWLVFGLLNLSLLLDVIGSFVKLNSYSIYWQDTMYRPQILLLLLATGMALLVLSLPLLQLRRSDQPLLVAYACLALMRGADLFFSLTPYGFVPRVQYDDMVMPVANFFWHGNIIFSHPLLACLPSGYNEIYGLSHGNSGTYILMLLDQVRSGLDCGMWGIPLAWLGNLLWLSAVLLVCNHAVRRYATEHLT